MKLTMAYFASITPYRSCTQTGADLKVPRWTVEEIVYEPHNSAKLTDLNLDLRKFRKVKEISDVLDVISYVNDEDGVEYTFHEDRLNQRAIFSREVFRPLTVQEVNKKET